MKQKKVLLIDDEITFSMMLKENLEEDGLYQVKTERKPANALQAALEFKPDIIFLDLIMPDIEGSQVAAELRSSDELKSIPIVFLTALISKEEADSQGTVIGQNPFIAKPATTEEIIDCIEKHTSN